MGDPLIGNFGDGTNQNRMSVLCAAAAAISAEAFSMLWAPDLVR
jgi:hypothetical protein